MSKRKTQHVNFLMIIHYFLKKNSNTTQKYVSFAIDRKKKRVKN